MALGLSGYEEDIVDRALKGEPLTLEERLELLKIGRLIESKKRYVNSQMGALIEALDEDSEMHAEFTAKLEAFNETADTIARVAAERGAADEGAD